MVDVDGVGSPAGRPCVVLSSHSHSHICRLQAAAIDSEWMRVEAELKLQLSLSVGWLGQRLNTRLVGLKLKISSFFQKFQAATQNFPSALAANQQGHPMHTQCSPIDSAFLFLFTEPFLSSLHNITLSYQQQHSH